MAARDTIYTSAGGRGVFVMRKVPVGKAKVKITMVGYKPFEQDINVAASGETSVWAMLEVAAEQIEKVTIKGKPDPMSVKGDTLIYHAAGVSVPRGDELIGILEQMPGVEVSESGVKVMDKSISRIYIDGRLLFGDNPMSAITNLSADNVVNIKAYDEYVNKDPRHKTRKNDEKQRVLDISTKTKIKVAWTANALGSLGADIGETARTNKLRYAVGGDGNLFSEKLQINGNFNANNISRSSNRSRNMIREFSQSDSYTRDMVGEFNLRKTWLSDTPNFPKGVLAINYAYNNNYRESGSIVEQIYFPSEDFDSRRYENSSSNASSTATHALHLISRRNINDGSVSLSANASFGNSDSRSRNVTSNTIDNLSPVGNRASNNSDSKSFKISGSLNGDKRFADKFQVSIGGRYDFTQNSGNELRLDTLSSTATTKVIESTSGGFTRRVDGNVNLSYHLDRISINLGSSIAYNNSLAQRTALDMTDLEKSDLERIDSTNTYDYSRNNTTISASAQGAYYFESIKGNLILSLNMRSEHINRDERFPGEYNYNRTFNSLVPSLVFITDRMINNISVTYDLMTSTPSIEQLRPQINNSNLYSLSVGNPDLKQAYQHQLMTHYSTVLGSRGTTFSAELSGMAGMNEVVSKRIFFTGETYLTQYDYTVPAQSTLTTYENVDNRWQAAVSTAIDTPVGFLKSNLSCGLSFNYDSAPSYVNQELNTTDSYAPSIRVALKSNFSRKVQVNVSSRSSYTYSRNTAGQDTKFFTEELGVNWNITEIFNRLFTGGSYKATFYRRSGSANNSSSSINTHILNLSAGVKFLSNNQAQLSFNIYDVLNRNPGFSTSMQSNYISNRWRQSFGRYFVFNFAYKFNSTHAVPSRSGWRGGDRRDAMGAGRSMSRPNNMRGMTNMGGGRVNVRGGRF